MFWGLVGKKGEREGEMNFCFLKIYLISNHIRRVDGEIDSVMWSPRQVLRDQWGRRRARVKTERQIRYKQSGSVGKRRTVRIKGVGTSGWWLLHVLQLSC